MGVGGCEWLSEQRRNTKYENELASDNVDASSSEWM